MPAEIDRGQLRAMHDEMRPERVELRERALFCGPPGMDESVEEAILDMAAFAVRAAATPFADDARTMLNLMLVSHIDPGDEAWGATLQRILEVVQAMQTERTRARIAQLEAEIAAEGPDASAG